MRSGKDRSVFTIYAFLQLIYGITESDARTALSVRIGNNGKIISNLAENQEGPQNWLARALATQS